MGFDQHISNQISVGADERFAAILGANPSQGARSPALWNAAFAAHDGSEKMVPLDVDGGNLALLLADLEADGRFMGGAVTAPHKETTAQWLDGRLTPTAQKIGAVNCLFRRDGQGPLWGTNTDGEGALVCIEAARGPVKGHEVVQLGAGGAGKAVAAYLCGAGARLTLCVRESEKILAFAGRIGARVVAWENRVKALGEAVLAINTTSLGGVAGNMVDQTPLDSEAISRLPANAWAYDIIYDPCPTRFLVLAAKHGLKTVDGRCMNLEQAILGFGYAADEPKGHDATRAAMEQAKAGL